MAAKALPCPTVLRLLLDYDPETGEFTWKERASLWFKDGGKFTRKRQASAWNRKCAGTPALTADDGDGYRVGRLFDNLVRAHRVAWAIVHGRWPDKWIDHINGNPADNRIANLREATARQNAQNTRGRSNSSSQYKGVAKQPCGKKWVARIRSQDGKQVHLGVFNTEQEAAVAYNEAALRFRGDWARLNTVA